MTDSQKRKLVHEAVANVTEQIFINANKVCTYNSHLWALDLAAYSLEAFLKQPLDKQFKISIEDDKLENYLTRSMSMGIHSSTSPFYIQYRKPTYHIRELYTNSDYSEYGIEDGFEEAVERSEQEDKVRKFVDTLDYYNRHLINEHYYNGIPAAHIAKKLSIHPNTLIRDIRKVLKKLKKHMENE